MTGKWETNIGQLRLIAGTRQEHPQNIGIEEPRSLLPIRSRGKGRLYALVELSGETFGREEMCQDLVTAITEEYFHTPGTVTYGLRQAVLLANTQLLRANTRVTSEHRMGGVACVVLRDGEVFIAQAGWPMVYLIHHEHVDAYPDTTLGFEDTSMLGQRQTTEVRLFHAPVQPGDIILMTDGPMARQLGITRIGQIISGSVERAMSNLETLAPPEDCTAMVIQIGSSDGQPSAQREQWAFMPVERPSVTEREPEPAPAPLEVEPPPPQEFYTPPVAQIAEPVETPETAEPAVPTIGERTQAAFVTVAQGMRTLGERMLPDRAPKPASQRRRRTTRTRQRRGQEAGQPNLGIAAALAIPVLALIIVAGYILYRNWSIKSQFETKLEAARLKRDVAMSNAESPPLARNDWQDVIALADEANAIQSDDPQVLQLLNQAAIEIDYIDGVTRLGQVHKLYEYATPGSAPSRIVVAGLDIYVLDRGTGRIYHHALNEQRNALRNADADQVLIQEAQVIEEQTLGPLVDVAWAKDGGERQAGALLILDRNGLLVEYDPSWEQLQFQVLGGKDVWRDPVALHTFDSNLYILDTVANQIWKYPAQQFANAPAHWIQGDASATSAVDIGIDGTIFILHNDGKLVKYYGGETIPFDITRIPQPLVSANGLYMDIEEVAQYIYIADASEMRIVQLDREGVFIRQLRPPAEREASFRQLSGLFIDEIAGKLYYTTAGSLYVTDLPPVQG